MKCQNLFSGKNKKNISICHLLKILPSMLSVNHLSTVSSRLFNTGCGFLIEVIFISGSVVFPFQQLMMLAWCMTESL